MPQPGYNYVVFNPSPGEHECEDFDCKCEQYDDLDFTRTKSLLVAVSELRRRQSLGYPVVIKVMTDDELSSVDAVMNEFDRIARQAGFTI